MRYRIFLFLLWALLGLSSHAAVPPVKGKPKVPAKLVADSNTVISPKHFNTAYLDSLKKLPEFQYHETVSGPSLWTRFWRWFWSLFGKLDRMDSGGSWLVNIIFRILVIAGIGAIVFLILRLLGVDFLRILKRKPAEANLPFEESLEDIHAIDFDNSLEQAISQRNYRLAVRLLYLKALKQMSDKGLIHWQIDKTNSTYVNELNNPEQRETFTVLTRQFEYVWYGEFTINEQSFQNIRTLFTNFKQTLA